MRGYQRRAGLHRFRVLVCAVVLLALPACGGEEPAVQEAAEAAGTTTTSSDDTATVPDPATESGVADAGADAELPSFMSDFDRVCTTQVGFPGAARYNQEPGPHKVQLFEEYREDDNYLETSRSLPAAWIVKQDANYEDNSELAQVELIACADEVEQQPTGKICTFDSDGQEIKLELVNATVEVTVYEATTGEALGTETLQAQRKECPSFVTFQEGDTELVNDLTDDQLIKVLKPFVNP